MVIENYTEKEHTEDVIGIGMGEQGYYKNKDELLIAFGAAQKALLSSEAAEPKISAEFENMDIRILTPDSATIIVDIYIYCVTFKNSENRVSKAFTYGF